MFYPICFMIYPNSFLNRVLSYWYLALFISIVVSIIAYLLYDSLSVLLAHVKSKWPSPALPHLLAAALSHWLSPVIFHWFSSYSFPLVLSWSIPFSLSPSALPHWLSPALSHELFPVRFCLLVPGFV